MKRFLELLCTVITEHLFFSSLFMHFITVCIQPYHWLFVLGIFFDISNCLQVLNVHLLTDTVILLVLGTVHWLLEHIQLQAHVSCFDVSNVFPSTLTTSAHHTFSIIFLYMNVCAFMRMHTSVYIHVRLRVCARVRVLVSNKWCKKINGSFYLLLSIKRVT